MTIGIVLSGAFIGNNNTLITEAVMGAAPVERPVASAAYSFVRFCGGAIGPYVALKLFGAPPDVHVHAPFWFGAASVLVGVVILAAGARPGRPARWTDHDEVSAPGRGRGGAGRRPRLSPTDPTRTGRCPRARGGALGHGCCPGYRLA